MAGGAPSPAAGVARGQRPAGGPVAALGWAAVALVLCAGPPARAHESRFSSLQLTVREARIEGTWEVHRADARIALGLDAGPEGEAGWREVRERTAQLSELLRGGLRLRSDAGPCPLEVLPGFTETQEDTAVARLRAVCPAPVVQLELEYGLFSDLDPQHRGYFSVQDARLTHVGVFAAGERSVRLDVHRLDRWRTLADYGREGAWHIWTGIDHVLFLIALLLPAPLMRGAEGWSRRPSPAPVAREVVGIVTAFTVAHSVTLVLAVLDAVDLPRREVEIAIAISVWAAAWNNLRPFLPARGPWLAGGFGLLHGFGFAGALEQLGLPAQARGLALASFNLGVEAGQLVIVAVVMPVLYVASGRPGYPRYWLGGGSWLVAWIAAVWALERWLGLRLLPGS